MPTFRNNLARKDIYIGVLYAIAVNGSIYPDSLKTGTEELSKEVGLFSEKYSTRRKAVRDILRNGSYKPSGRGKPASEYLVRMISEGGALPMIHPVVDIFNFLSARYQVPISVWDLESLDSSVFTFDLGCPGDSYQFNNAGHRIDLQDLVVGFAIEDNEMIPVVSPVKDSHRVKIMENVERIAAAVYIPQSERYVFEEMVTSAATMLQEASSASRVWSVLLESGQSKDLQLDVKQSDQESA